MSKIAIITDSDASLPAQIAAQYGIYQVPITIHFDDTTYTTGVDIDDASLFVIIDRLNKLPTTAAPAPHAFAQAFQAAFDNGAESVICICVSSKISSTYNSAVSAREMLPEKDITVVDSLNLCMAQGFMVLAAAEAARSGASKDEAIAAALETGKHIHVFAVLPTLKYLAMGGRVGKFAAGMADTLNIKPILTARDGKLELLEKIRTQKKAIERLLELAQQSVQGKQIDQVALIHVNNLEGAQAFGEILRKALPCPENMITAEFTAGLSVHAGSGVVGVVLVTKD